MAGNHGAENRVALERFTAFLERTPRDDPDFDIRAHVLGLRDKKVGIGLTEETLTAKFGANLRRVFPNLVAVDNPAFPTCEAFIAHGTIHEDAEKSHRGARDLFKLMPRDAELILTETSFLATSHSWSHSRASGDPSFACLGYIYDDLAHYFMADYPNRITQKLNSSATPTDAERTRARTLIERIVTQRISKYNAQPMLAPQMRPGFSRRVLVCDQTYADASTVFGKVGEAEFEAMLQAAIDENPDAEILVKTHPDTSWERKSRTGYYNHLASTDRVTMLREPMNPFVLFELVDTVYVGTSQMGFEALLAGKKVVTFGAPFYAGWGLTDDRQTIPHRARRRALEEVFHYFYVWYTIYHVPGIDGVAQIEDALAHIERNRPYPYYSPEMVARTEPRISVVIPIYNVEKYLGECLASVQRQSLQDIEIIAINDASPDDSQSIVERLAAGDARIRPIVLDQNVGLGFVRNKGIEAARGKYIWFLDSDDWLSSDDILSRLYERAEANGLDMLRARVESEAIFAPDDTLLFHRPDDGEAEFDIEIDKTTYADSPVILNNRHCWNWLYRREFLIERDVKFVTRKWEERAFLVQALTEARAIGLAALDGPTYRVRAGSISRTERSRDDVDMMLRNFRHSFETLVKHGADKRDSALREHLNFHATQYVKALLSDIYRIARNHGEAEERAMLASVREDFERLDLRPEDLIDRALLQSSRYFGTGACQLFVAAVRAESTAFARKAASLEQIPQAELYDALLSEPDGDAQAMLQAALSRYARNRMVARETAAGKPKTRPRIIVHIGATKTGSTYIQHTLEQNRAQLLRHGVWYPEVGLFWQRNRPHKQAGHAPFSGAAANKDPDLKGHIESGLALLGDRVHTIVLSSEAFFLTENAPLLAEYFSGHPLEMVVYLRRQDEWANSQYCEFVAGGAVGRVDAPVDDWLALPATRDLLDYARTLDMWASRIGRENIRVRLFDALHEGDLLADFAEATGLKVIAELPRPDKREQNETMLTGAHVEALRHFNQRPFATKDSYFAFIEEVGAALTEWRDDHGIPLTKAWVLSEAQADRIMAEQAAGNALIARAYLGRSDGVLFEPASPKPEPSAIYQEELTLIERIYQRHAPGAPSERFAQRGEIAPRLMNYGVFGWRLWLLTPAFAALYQRVATSDRMEEFRREPALYAQVHWGERRPWVAALLYPQGNVMGPGGVFSLWIPVARRMIASLKRPDMQERFEQSPVEFARSMRHPVRRIIGRIMFPLGELRG